MFENLNLEFLPLLITEVTIAIFLGSYGLFTLGINLWEKVTGKKLEDKFQNCLPWCEEDR